MNLLPAYIFIIGIIIGSFLNVCICRIPMNHSIVKPPSHCPECNTYLKPIDLIPIVSYLLLRGRCRYCGDRISPRYPAVELLNGLMYMLLFSKFGWTGICLKYCIFSSLLLVVGLIDYDHKIIPDGIMIFGLIAGACFLFSGHFRINLFNGLMGFFVGGGVFFLIAMVTNGAMGGGDIKLMAVTGLWLGWKYILLVMLLSFVLGAMVSMVLLLLKLKSRKDEIPFGPFISLSAFIAMYFGQEIILWYRISFFA